jgi:hypothetical protein
MRRTGRGFIPLYSALLVLAIAVLGALIHPVVLLLRALPWDLSLLLSFLDPIVNFVGDALLWAILAFLGLMTIGIVRGRKLRRVYMRTGRLPESPAIRQPVDPSTQPARVVVAITALNDPAAVELTVKDFKSQPHVLEVIVVDNASTDNTAEVAAAAGAKVVIEKGRGFGHTCIRALQEALKVREADTIVLTEGDGTFEAADLAKFQAYIHQADMVLGNRVAPVLVERESQMDHFFLWGNLTLSALLRLRFWDSHFLGVTRLSDMGCTYRAIGRGALERIVPHLTVGGMHFLANMMVVALSMKLTIIEIPVTFRRRIGISKGASKNMWSGLKVGVAMIWHILTYRPPKTPPQTADYPVSASSL